LPLSADLWTVNDTIQWNPNQSASISRDWYLFALSRRNARRTEQCSFCEALRAGIINDRVNWTESRSPPPTPINAGRWMPPRRLFTERNEPVAPDRWRTSSADRTTVICRPAGRTVSALILPTRGRGSRKSDAEKNVVFLPRTKVLTKFITENFVYVYDVRRRCDCLASSAPFTNIQTYLLTYLMWYKKTDVQLSSYIPHGRGRKS